MAVLSWGKPTVEIKKAGAPGGYTKLPVIVENTANLTTEQGKKLEGIGEGGEVVDVRIDKNKYTFECELFVKKGDSKPVEDEDGIILDNYALRLTPEDPANEGFIMEKTSVSVMETWTSEQGKRWKYTFAGLIPDNGTILKPYIAESEG